MLLQLSLRKLHNSPSSDPEDGGLKEARDTDNNIIISDSTLSSLLTPQQQKYQYNTRSCVFVNGVYPPKLYIPHYYHGMIGIKKAQIYKPKFSKQKVW